jgi:hypothetical protein
MTFVNFITPSPLLHSVCPFSPCVSTVALMKAPEDNTGPYSKGVLDFREVSPWHELQCGYRPAISIWLPGLRLFQPILWDVCSRSFEAFISVIA